MKSLLLAIIAIVVDVLGYFFPAFALYFFIIGFVLAIIAYVTGKNAVKANPSDGKAKAGKIIGLIFMILGIIAIVLAILGMVGLAMAGFALAGLGS